MKPPKSLEGDWNTAAYPTMTGRFSPPSTSRYSIAVSDAVIRRSISFADIVLLLEMSLEPAIGDRFVGFSAAMTVQKQVF